MTTTRPLTTTYLVIRHAESEANAGNYFASQSDSPLTELGRAQARALADALATAEVHAVYASDLSRARDTVAPIAAARGLPVVETPLLRERAMGELTGCSFDDAKARFPDVWARLVARDPDVVPPGGESHVALAARVRALLADLAGRHAGGGTVVLGSHGGTIHHIVRQLLGVHDLAALRFSLSVSNASVTRVDVVEVAPGERVARLSYANRVVAIDGAPVLP